MVFGRIKNVQWIGPTLTLLWISLVRQKRLSPKTQESCINSWARDMGKDKEPSIKKFNKSSTLFIFGKRCTVS